MFLKRERIHFFIFYFIVTQVVFSQAIRVIDNKGTLKTVNNNKVTTTASAPTNPVVGDVWFDNSNVNQVLTKIWNGAVWVVDEHKGTPGSVFFAGSNTYPTENSAQFFWDNTNNRLYLGSILSGTNKLNVDGTTRTSGLNNSDGTATQPSYRFTSDASTGIFLPSNNQFAIATNGIEAIRIDATQKVGIGLTAPQESLHIANNMRLNGSFGDKDGDKGTLGQILSSTVTGTNWVDPFSLTVITVTTNYTLSATDTGKVLDVTSNTPITITVPTGLPIGFQVSITQSGTGQVTFVGSGGMVINNRWSGTKTTGQWAKAGIEIRAANSSVLSGDVL